MAYAGLESIFQNEGPNSGAVTGGQREALAQAGDLLTQGRQVQDLRRDDVMNPLNAQYRQGEIDQQAPNLRILNTKAQLGEDTLGSTISSTNAENESKFTKANYEKLDHVAQTAAAIGIQLQAIPEGFARDSAARQLLQQHGVPADSQAGQYVLSTGIQDPQKLLEVARKINEAKPAFMTKMAEENMKMNSHIQGIRETGKYQKELEQMRIDAGKYKKAQRGLQDYLEKALASGNWEVASTAYDRMAQLAVEDGNREDAIFYQQKAKEYGDKALVKANSAKTGSVDVGQVAGLATNPVPTITPPAIKAASPASAPAALSPEAQKKKDAL